MIQQWNRPLTKFTYRDRAIFLAGLALVIVFGSLAGLDPSIAVLCSVMLLVTILVVPRPVLIVYALVLMMPLTGGLARGAVVPILRVGQLVVVVGFILSMLAKPSQQGKFRLTAIDLAFVLFMLAQSVFPVLTLYYRGDHLSTSENIYGLSSIQLLLGPIQYYLLYRAVVATISSERQIKVVLKLTLVASIIVSIIGILQKMGVGPVKTFIETYYPPLSLGYTVADVKQRITSTLQHFSGLAAYLTFTIIIALICYNSRKRLKISSVLLAATILFDSIALILTGTLAAWIGLAVGAIIVFLLSRSIPKMVILILLGIALAALIFQPFISARLGEQIGPGAEQGLLPSSLAFRVKLWQELFLPAISQHIFFGSGPTPAVLNNFSAEDSQYLMLLLRGGVFYFFSYFLLIGVSIASCWRRIKKKKEDASRSVAIATLAILVAMSVMNISAEYFTYVGGTQTLWTLIAIVVASDQFVLNTPAPAKHIIDGKGKTITLPFHNPSAIEAPATVSMPIVRREPVGERKIDTSHSLIPNATEPALRKVYWNRGYLIKLDWHFVKDSAVVGMVSMVARVLGLLFATLLARFLTPDDFGFFRYSITLVTFITVASNSSPISIARFLAAHPNDQQTRDRYFSNGVVGLTLLLIVLLFISLPILWLLHALNLGTITCVVCLAIYYCYLYVARGLGSAWRMSLTYSLSNVALLVALFVVLGFFKLRTSTAALMIYGLADLVPILLLELVKPMKLRFRPSLISKAVLLELTRFAIPLVIASGAYTIWNGIDMLLVENYYPHAAGSFAAAKTLGQAFIFIPAAIAWVLLPRAAALNSDKSKRYSAGAILVALLISLVGLIIVYLWGHELIILTFGQRYSDAYLLLLVQSVGMSIYSLYIVLECFIIGRGRPNLTAQAMGTAILGTAATGFWLTSWLGPLGASLAFTIGAVLSFVVLIFNAWRFLQHSKQGDSAQVSSIDSIADATV